ncbi:MAG: tape measure protein [Armatimonadetes bacterium]|nr:tape measure protein [Armatimonadota bacterium]MDW8122703.1 tape measure protein [Armatimonadota bacterium]
MAREGLVVQIRAEGAEQTQRALQGVQRAVQSLGQTVATLRSPLAQLSQRLSQTGESLQRTRDSLKRIGNSLALFGTVTTAAVGGAVVAFAQYGSEVQKPKIAFETLTKSQEKANRLFAELTKFAAQTPFEHLQVMKFAQQLMGVGVAAEKVIPLLRSMGDIVAGVGGGSVELERVSRAIAQVMAKGRVQMEEMLQLMEARIPVFQILQRELGLTGKELSNLGRQGISATQFLEAFQRFSAEQFGGQMQRMMGTIEGAWSNLKDTVQAALGVMGEALAGRLVPIINDFTNRLQMLTRSRDFAVFAQNFGVAMTNVAEAGLKVVTVLIGLVNAFAKLPAPVQQAVAAFALVSGPLSLIIGTTTRLIGSLLSLTGTLMKAGAAVAGWVASLQTVPAATAAAAAATQGATTATAGFSGALGAASGAAGGLKVALTGLAGTVGVIGGLFAGAAVVVGREVSRIRQMAAELKAEQESIERRTQRIRQMAQEAARESRRLGGLQVGSLRTPQAQQRLRELNQMFGVSGQRASQELAKGIKKGAPAVDQSMFEVTRRTRRYLPKSPPEVGPLKDIVQAGTMIPILIAEGIQRGLGFATAAGAAVASAIQNRLTQPRSSPVGDLLEFHLRRLPGVLSGRERLGNILRDILADIQEEWARKLLEPLTQAIQRVFSRITGKLSDALARVLMKLPQSLQLALGGLALFGGLRPIEEAVEGVGKFIGQIGREVLKVFGIRIGGRRRRPRAPEPIPIGFSVSGPPINLSTAISVHLDGRQIGSALVRQVA